MNKTIRCLIYGIFGAGLFIATSMVFIAFSPRQINEYWLILPASLGFILGILESTVGDENAR